MRVFLDANVLFPPLVRRLVLDAAAQRLFMPFWSQRVLDEWRIAAVSKQGPNAQDRTQAAQRAMIRHFPDAMVAPQPEIEAMLDLRDPADNHVLAAAIACRADILLTFNLRDFPARQLAVHGIAPRHPDSLLWEMHSHAPDIMACIVRDALPDFSVPLGQARAALKRARLPRFAKAVEQDLSGPASR